MKEHKIDFQSLFEANKNYVYSVLFYLIGLLLGTFIYEGIQSESVNSRIHTVLNLTVQNQLLQLFLNRLSVYLILFCITVLMGLFVIGFTLTNCIPIITGCIIGVKLAYYYVSFGMKGIGYSALLILPESAILMTVIIYCIQTSSNLSREVLQSLKKEDTALRSDVKPYLKQYFLYFILLIISAFVNGLLTYGIAPLIKL